MDVGSRDERVDITTAESDAAGSRVVKKREAWAGLSAQFAGVDRRRLASPPWWLDWPPLLVISHCCSELMFRERLPWSPPGWSLGMNSALHHAGDDTPLG